MNKTMVILHYSRLQTDGRMLQVAGTADCSRRMTVPESRGTDHD